MMNLLIRLSGLPRGMISSLKKPVLLLPSNSKLSKFSSLKEKIQHNELYLGEVREIMSSCSQPLYVLADKVYSPSVFEKDNTPRLSQVSPYTEGLENGLDYTSRGHIEGVERILIYLSLNSMKKTHKLFDSLLHGDKRH